MTEGESLHELVGHWVDYSKLRSNPSVEGFSNWLKARISPPATENATTLQEKKICLGQVFGRLVNFTEMWGKLAFKDLPIKQFEDFGILTEVKYRTNPSKNEVANLLLNEKSTAFEIIKRLIREGLLTEEVDPHDKRIRRIRLSDYGQEVVEKAEIQAGKVSEVLMGDSSEAEIDSMITKFQELDKYHTDLYENVEYESIDDLLK
ncbi:MAG: MarR family winged helix-turn-helix transcriptional regulator [Bacteroidota bacterium]